MLKRFSAILLSVALFGEPIAAGQDDRDITTPCNAHLASITSTEPHAYEKYFEWEKLPAPAAQFADAKLPNTVETIALAPVTADEYKTIFMHGKDKDAQKLSEAQSRDVESVQSALKAKLNKDHGDRDFDKKDYKSVLQAKAASFVIVIGHNEHGFLRLLDGSIVFMDAVVSGARPDQRVIMISCDSMKRIPNKERAATVDSEVTYDDAFDIADHLTSFIKRAAGKLSIVEVQTELVNYMQGSRFQKIAYFVMKVACGLGTAIAIALIIRALDPCKDKDSSDCSDGKQNDSNTKDGKQPTSRRFLGQRCEHLCVA